MEEDKGCMKGSVWIWILIIIIIIIIILLLCWWAWPWGCLPTKGNPNKQQIQSFHVTINKKDESHPNYGKGADLGYVINGVQGKSITLKVGKQYRFVVQAEGHPFYISTSERGGPANKTESSTDTSCETNSETPNCLGYVKIFGTPIETGSFNFFATKELPQPLYYSCCLHEYMGSSIIIEE